jgi:predicted secreted hydrolase
VAPQTAQFAEGRLALEYKNCRAQEDDQGGIRIRFPVKGHQLDLHLSPDRPPMMVNGDGVIDMPEGTTSRYYSFTRMRTTGTLRGPTGSSVRLAGQSWFDHQWGNFIALFKPWDWFSFQMEDGSDYNLFHFRQGRRTSRGELPEIRADEAGRRSLRSRAGRSCVNVLRQNGQLQVDRRLAVHRKRWWKSPRTGDLYVTGWTLDVPATGERFEVATPVEDQEMARLAWHDVPPGYWEGAIDVVRHNPDGTVTRGLGYAEQFPYRPRGSERVSRRADARPLPGGAR